MRQVTTDLAALGLRIRRYRLRKGLSQEVLAHRVGRSEGWLFQVENGSTDPRYGDLVNLARELDVDVAVLMGEPTGATDRPGIQLPSGLGHERMAAAECICAIDRRVLDDLAALTRHYGQLNDTMAPGSLLPAVGSHHQLLSKLLADASEAPLRRSLASTLGETAMMLGWLCFLVEDRRQARAHWESAHRLAGEHEDRALEAHVLIARSQLCSSLPHGGRGGEPRLAISLLDLAVERSQGMPGLRAWALSRRAEEHAAAGRERESEEDLAAAERDLGQEGGELLVLPGPRTAVDLAGFRGNCAVLLGHDREAAEVLERAVGEAPEERTTLRAVLLNDLGAALGRQGQVEAACAAFEHSVDLAVETGAAVHVQRVAGALNVLGRWERSAPVRRLYQRLQQLV